MRGRKNPPLDLTPDPVGTRLTFDGMARRNEILHLTWDEVDLVGGVIRLSPRRSKTRVGRVLPISAPLRAVLDRRAQQRPPRTSRVFLRDGVPVRVWRTALRDACRQANVPHRMLHDCRRTAARNLIRAGVPERIAMLLTGHKTRAVFDRYNIVTEQELLAAGERLAAYVAGESTPEGAASRAATTRQVVPLRRRGLRVVNECVVPVV